MGLIGIYNHPEASKMAYFGLYAQQHRGQESCGIAAWDGVKQAEYRGLGLVPDAFNEDILNKLPGQIAIGHVRYGGKGEQSLRNAEPFCVRHGDLQLAVAHNGALINNKLLRKRLENEGAIFHTDTDSELLVHLIILHLGKHELVEAVRQACLEVEGAYCFVILANETLIAARDPHGVKPLSLGRTGDTLVVASETCALDLLDAGDLGTIEPGEMLIINESGMRRESLGKTAPHRHCIFELVYFARPDSIVFDEEVYSCRKRMGNQMSIESTPDADFVLPFPDSGVYCALGFAQQSGLPYEHAIIRNHYVGRTFIQPTQEMRNFGVRVKLNPVRGFLRGKRVILADDSIVRGTTIRTRARHLRELGVKEVHFRVSSPPVTHPCFYGVDFPSRKELIASSQDKNEIQKFIGLDSLEYISIEGLRKTVKNPDNFCYACFTGDYPIRCPGCDPCEGSGCDDK